MVNSGAAATQTVTVASPPASRVAVLSIGNSPVSHPSVPDSPSNVSGIAAVYVKVCVSPGASELVSQVRSSLPVVVSTQDPPVGSVATSDGSRRSPKSSTNVVAPPVEPVFSTVIV